MTLNTTTNVRNNFSDHLLDAISEHGIERLYNNIKTEVASYTIDGKRILSTTTNEVLRDNCYAVSPFAFIISYSQVELHKVKRKYLLPLFYLLIGIFSFIIKAAQIDKTETIGNIMLSTNFYGSFWRSLDTVTLRKLAYERHPAHAYAIRSLNQTQNSPLIERLEREGWMAVVTRQVYLFKNFDERKRDLLRDKALSASPRYVFIAPNIDSVGDFEIAEQLYNQLYLQKYTKENIQYTALFMQELVQRGALHVRLLKDTERDEIIGVVGIAEDEHTITAPIVGYDLGRPASDALYRRCIFYILTYAQKRTAILNLSAGAPDFKMNRGAIPEIEYMYVYTKHLSLYRRAVWWTLSKISLHIYRPTLIDERL